jgi:hypothetical protein
MARPDRPGRLQVVLKCYSPECVELNSLLKKSLSDPSIGQIVSKHSGNTAKTLQ